MKSPIAKEVKEEILGKVKAGEPTGPILEHLLESLLRTDAKLQELGFTYYNGKVVVLEGTEEENRA